MLIIFLPVIRGNIHLSNTEDGFSIEYYDCFNHRNISYCRRPSPGRTIIRQDQSQILL